MCLHTVLYMHGTSLGLLGQWYQQKQLAFTNSRFRQSFAAFRWQALSRSLERVVAVHGDEGDDQHGLKVHEVHDMLPGLPCKPAGDALHGALPLQPSLPQQSVVKAAQHGQARSKETPECSQPQEVQSNLLHHKALQPQQQDDSADTSGDAAGVIDLVSPLRKEERPGDVTQVQLGQPSQLFQPPDCQLGQIKRPIAFALNDQLQGSPQAASNPTQLVAGSTLLPTDVCRIHMDALCPAGTAVTVGTAGQQCVTMPASPKQQQHQCQQKDELVVKACTTQPAAVHLTTAHPAAMMGGGSDGLSQPTELQYKQSVGMQSRIKALLRKEEALEGHQDLDRDEDADDINVQALTQLEVIDAQTADEEKPQASERLMMVATT